MASQLVNPSMPATCRHFGFQLYEHLISKRWNVLGEDSHEQLKGVSIQVLANLEHLTCIPAMQVAASKHELSSVQDHIVSHVMHAAAHLISSNIRLACLRAADCLS